MQTSPFESLITGRKTSLFQEDIEKHYTAFQEAFKNSSVAIIGAAGSIGYSVVREILRYQPKRMALIDLNENNLVEVIRDLRSDVHLVMPENFQTLPIGLGSYECSHFFTESKHFDYIFNLSAVKHVRSEKDKYSLLRMIDTNNLFLFDFLQSLKYKAQKFFSVSSDKAVNPGNLMGASKCLMENIMGYFSEKQVWSSARFANVAFSLGSLPYGFLNRIEKKQALAAPNDVKRFFISHEEAAQLCILSAVLAKNTEVFFPKLQSELNESTFSDLAVNLLKHLGYEAVLCGSDEEARSLCESLIPQKKWPCYFSASNTEGEKGFEEFYSHTEKVDLSRFSSVGVVKSLSSRDAKSLLEFLEFHNQARRSGQYTKEDYIRYFEKLVPGFAHVQQTGNLDGKM